MKKVICGTIFFAAIVAIVSNASAAEYPWELKKDADGIRVYARKVAGSPILEYKGTAVVSASLDSVLRLFDDNRRMKEWFYQCAEGRLLKANTPDDEVLYFAVSAPWPVQPRDLVFRRWRTKDPATGAVEYRSSSVLGVYPEQKGRVRMPSSKGFWRFTPRADGRTEIYYQQHGEVGGYVPVWLVNLFAVNIPFNTLFRFRQLLSKN